MLARTWDGSFDPSGWLMSQKYDGVRAIWTGEEFLSRTGKKYFAPAWFTEHLPKGLVLDGELVASTLEKTTSIVRKLTPINEEWSQLRYVIFDSMGVGNYSMRMRHVGDWMHRYTDDLRNTQRFNIADQWACGSRKDFDVNFRVYRAKGCEGMMLRDPNGLYEYGKRSKTLYKVKEHITDEGVVVGWDKGEGKYTEVMGTLYLKHDKFGIVEVGSGFTDEERDKPPAIGQLVTFKYWDLTSKGSPKFPIFVTVRNYE